jgi:hypothetical protein
VETIGALVIFDCILSEHSHGELFYFREEKLALAWLCLLGLQHFYSERAIFQAVHAKLKIRSFGRLHRKFLAFLPPLKATFLTRHLLGRGLCVQIPEIDTEDEVQSA